MTVRADERPLPGSHARDLPSGSLEESAATLFAAAAAARDAEGSADHGALRTFYLAVTQATLLLPVPPADGEAARDALERAVDDREEVEVGVMAARAADGSTVSVVFASYGSLAAWAPVGTTSLALPARVVLDNLVAAGLPAILDPAGPIPYRFEIEELAALAAGLLPGSDQQLAPIAGRSSVRVRLPRADTAELAAEVRRALSGRPGIREAYLVETDDGLLLGLVGGGGAVPFDPPEGVSVAWLSEPMLGSVRSLTEPLFRGHR
jgi:hypothetical protein